MEINTSSLSKWREFYRCTKRGEEEEAAKTEEGQVCRIQMVVCSRAARCYPLVMSAQLSTALMKMTSNSQLTALIVFSSVENENGC